MFSERLLTIFELMASRQRSGAEGGLLCAVAQEITGVSATGIALATHELPMATFCSSSDVARDLLDLEMTVGEGPCLSTLSSDRAVAEPSLTSQEASRWMLYTPEALASGTRAVFGFPVRIGVIRLGVMCLFNDTEGELSDRQSTDALLMASVVARGLIALEAGASASSLSEELANEETFDFSVHQAAGMVAVQSSTSIATALVALRMHAFATSQSLAQVSGEVIARTLRRDLISHDWIQE